MRRILTPLFALVLAGLGAAQTPAAAADAAPAPAAPPAAAPAPAAAPPAAPGAPAQPTAAQAAAAQAAANLAVNETIGDWTLRCFRVEAIAPCDIIQVASQQETQRRVLLVSIAHVPSSNVYWMQVVVPLAVSLAKGMSVAAGEQSLTGLKFSRCERDGCYVEIQVPEPTIQALSALEMPSSITISAYGNDQVANLPLSVNGFAMAITRLRTEARIRARNPPAQ
jgi:invasion protein IalB